MDQDLLRPELSLLAQGLMKLSRPSSVLFRGFECPSDAVPETQHGLVNALISASATTVGLSTHDEAVPAMIHAL